MMKVTFWDHCTDSMKETFTISREEGCVKRVSKVVLALLTMVVVGMLYHLGVALYRTWAFREVSPASRKIEPLPSIRILQNNRLEVGGLFYKEPDKTPLQQLIRVGAVMNLANFCGAIQRQVRRSPTTGLPTPCNIVRLRANGGLLRGNNTKEERERFLTDLIARNKEKIERAGYGEIVPVTEANYQALGYEGMPQGFDTILLFYTEQT